MIKKSKPVLVDLHSTYSTRHPENFMQKLQQIVVKIKEFCGKKLGYEYKSVRNSVTSILKTPPIDKTPKEVASEVQNASKRISAKATAVEKYIETRKTSSQTKQER